MTSRCEWSRRINIDAYSDALVVLGTAGIVVPLVRRFGLSPILGYLGAGAILGPLGLGSFIDRLPLLHWVTVVDAKNVAGIAELGVVFLLFLIGLELSYDAWITMRRLVFGLGSLQIVLSTLVIGGVAAFAGNTPAAALILGSVWPFLDGHRHRALSNQRRLSMSLVAPASRSSLRKTWRSSRSCSLSPSWQERDGSVLTGCCSL